MKNTILNALTTLLLLLAMLFFILNCLKNDPSDPIGDNSQFTSTNSQDSNTHSYAITPQQLSWNLILINPWNPLPEDFSVNLTELRNGHYIDERAYPDLQAMMDAARAEGLSPIICSSYRTITKQEDLYENKVSYYLSQDYSLEESETEAAKWVARPGTSEHHTGLALDIVSLNYQLLDEEQENTPEQQWLMHNSYKYGFILRYPNDKSKITGIHYEPWHYRYVGKEIAKEIYEQGICLEEYLENLQK